MSSDAEFEFHRREFIEKVIVRAVAPIPGPTNTPDEEQVSVSKNENKEDKDLNQHSAAASDDVSVFSDSGDSGVLISSDSELDYHRLEFGFPTTKKTAPSSSFQKKSSDGDYASANEGDYGCSSSQRSKKEFGGKS